MAGYYAPCPEFDECNRLIREYFQTGQYERCFQGHLALAEQGYPLAECQVGYFYYEGLGVEQDLEKSLYWTRRAAEHGDRDAQRNMADWFDWTDSAGKKEELIMRSMMQINVKGSVEAVELYRRAFDAQVLCTYPNADGSYYHAELDAFGQIVAVSELEGPAAPGNTMMFCFHLGPGGEEQVRRAYEVLREGAEDAAPPGPCDYSSYQFALLDKFGVRWCLFV